METKASFLPLSSGEGFLGPVAGYFFANGVEGLGYYRDRRLEADRDHICAALVEELLVAGTLARVHAQAPLRAEAELERLLQRAVTIAEHAARVRAPLLGGGGDAGGLTPRGGGGAGLPPSLEASLEAEFARIVELPGGVTYLTKGSGVAVVASGRGCSEEVARRALRSVLEKAVPPPKKKEPPSEQAEGREEAGGRRQEKASSSSSSSLEVCEPCSRLRGRRRCAGCRRLGPLARRVRVVPCSAAAPLFEAWLATVEEGSEGGLGNRSAPAALRLLFILQQAAQRRALREWAAFALVYCRALRTLSRDLSAARMRGSFDSWLKWVRGRRDARAKLDAEAGGRLVPSWENKAAPLDGRPRWRGAAGGAKAVEALVSARVKGAKKQKGSRGGGGARGGGVGAPGSREWFQELGKEQAFARKAFGYIQ